MQHKRGLRTKKNSGIERESDKNGMEQLEKNQGKEGKNKEKQRKWKYL